MDYQHLLLVLPLAAFAGFLSGLLGIGGGILTIPIIVFLLKSSSGNLQYLQQVAVGTSFAVMVFTIFSSALSHYRNGNVRWDIIKLATLPIIIGTIVGSAVSPYIPSDLLQVIFILFITVIAIRSILNSNALPAAEIPYKPSVIKTVSGLTGLLSSWIGIGGGSIFVPFLQRYNIDIKKCLGTSAALGFPIAVIGTIMYVVTGLHYSSSLPDHTLGFVKIPYFISLAICTMLFAPLGAKVSSKAKPKMLKILFAILLLSIAAKMSWNLFY